MQSRNSPCCRVGMTPPDTAASSEVQAACGTADRRSAQSQSKQELQLLRKAPACLEPAPWAALFTVPLLPDTHLVSVHTPLTKATPASGQSLLAGASSCVSREPLSRDGNSAGAQPAPSSACPAPTANRNQRPEPRPSSCLHQKVNSTSMPTEIASSGGAGRAPSFTAP